MQNETTWKKRFNDLIIVVQKEIKRTALIGKKMVSASRSNALLNGSYEELGRLLAREIKENRLECNHPHAKELLDTIEKCERSIQKIAKEVKKIKKLGAESAKKTSQDM